MTPFISLTFDEICVFLKGIGLSVWALESLQTHIKDSLVLCWTWKIIVSNLKLAKNSQKCICLNVYKMYS